MNKALRFFIHVMKAMVTFYDNGKDRAWHMANIPSVSYIQESKDHEKKKTFIEPYFVK